MADIYKLVHPVKYFNDYISRKIRPDGRQFQDHRNIKLNVDSIKTAEASAVVKSGNTTVICGVQLELATPKAEEPDNGFLVTNVELPALCSSKFRPGPPSDFAQVVSNIVSDIIVHSKCVDLTDLCIVSDKLAWVLYCDIVCIDNDGSLVDASVLALIASLKTLTLPAVEYDNETEDIKVDTTIRKPLTLHGLPVTTSFGSYALNEKNIILCDPTSYEEEMCGGNGANFIVTFNKGLLCDIQKNGGCSLSVECQAEALLTARNRAKVIEEVVLTCLKNKDR